MKPRRDKINKGKNRGFSPRKQECKQHIYPTGNLVITESVNLPLGDVEVIVLQTVDTVDNTTVPASEPKI